MSRHTMREYLAADGIAVVPTLVGLIVRRLGVPVPPIDAAMLYLLAVVVASARFRRGPAVLASLVGIASFDFFFVHPFYTLSVADIRYVLTFGVMLVVALVMGTLTGRIRTQAEAARQREQRTLALYGLSRELAAARDREAVLAATQRSLKDTFAVDAAVLELTGGALSVRGASPYPLDERELAAAQWSLDRGRMAGRGTPTHPDAVALYLPLPNSGTAAVLGLPLSGTDEFQDPAQRGLLESLAGQAATALDRLALAERSRESQIQMEAERLRTSLLSSLSHDMRTPLASIEGAASTLLQETEPDRDARRDLAATIVQESHRMGRLVANLLDMIRVEAGMLQVHKEWQPLPDIIGVALLRTEEQLRAHAVAVAIPPDVPLVAVDEILLEQVFINLFENAAKHTAPGTPIEVGAESRPGELVVWVADRGPGLPAGEEDAIFRKFHRGTGTGRGIGLGLTICRGIVTAHGGRIWAENREGGGSVFRISLPITGVPPRLVAEDPAIDQHPAEAADAWSALPPSSS